MPGSDESVTSEPDILPRQNCDFWTMLVDVPILPDEHPQVFLKVVSEDLSVWEVTSVDGRQTAMITTIAASSSGRPEAPELVFDKFDNQYFLSRVVTVDADQREIPLTPARMEHEIVKLALKPRCPRAGLEACAYPQPIAGQPSRLGCSVSIRLRLHPRLSRRELL